MWKFLSRGLRETFERSANLGRNADARVKKEAHTKQTSYWKLTPAVRNCHASERKKCSGAKGREDGPNERKERITAHNYIDEWIGAFSYSSALVLGWVLTQPYSRWRKWYDLGYQQLPKKILPQSLVPLLARVAISQPINTIYTDPSPVKLCNETDDEAVTFGPITAEQALEEAGEELRSVHNAFLAEVENRKGVDLIQIGDNRKALDFFRSASGRGYAPAAYNLAQCHELGLGTRQDFAQAAKWYSKAADMGHANAMYNLGVFYAHGWGGLEPSKEKAKQLFMQAAVRGQPDARAALGLNQPPTPPPSIAEENSDWAFSDLQSERNDKTQLGDDPEELYNIGISYENSYEGNSSDPYLILHMYHLASELGHSEAKSRLNILKAYDAIGLLSEFLAQKKTRSSNLQVNLEGFRSVP